MERKKDTIDKFNSYFPSRLRYLMETNQTKQNDLAEYIGTSRQTISLYQNGSTSPDWEKLKKIAEYFKVPSDYLIGLTDAASCNPDIRSVVDGLNLHEDAATTLLQNKSDVITLFLDYLLLLPKKDLEKLCSAFVQYLYIRKINPTLQERLKENGFDIDESKKVKINTEINGFSLPDIPAKDALDYSRFELSRQIVKVADYTFDKRW